MEEEKIRRLRLQRGRGCDPAVGAYSRTSHQGSARREDPSTWRKCAAARAWLTCPQQANCRTGEAWSGRRGRGIRLRANRPAPARSTASRNCPISCSIPRAGTEGSPRPSRRRSSWAAEMAFSPPLTATYMTYSPEADVQGAWCAADRPRRRRRTTACPRRAESPTCSRATVPQNLRATCR